MTSALAANPAVRAIGIALIWFVVQGAVVGAVVAALLAALRRASANLRYLVACAGLATMALMPVVTAVRYWAPATVVLTDTSGTSQSDSVDVAPHTARTAPEREWLARLALDRVAPLVVLGWMAGVFAFTVQLFGGWLQVVRIRRGARPTQAFEWSATLVRLARHLKIARAVPLLESTLVGLPVVIGWLRPAILVPAGVFAGLTPDQIEAILAHELAHIRRGDYLVNALQRVVEIVLFYHPAVWWVSACIRREREHCCDDLAAPLASSRLTYARALVALEERRGRAPALAMAATGTGLFARVRRVVDPSSTIDSTLPKGGAMAIVSSVLAIVLTGTLSVGHAASQPPAKPRSAMEAPHDAVLTIPAADSARPAATRAVVQTAASAPQAHGSIRGTVSDQADGRIPGATVTVVPVSQDAPRRAVVVTNNMGQFEVPNLPDGAYDLTVALLGFTTATRRAVIVSGATVDEAVLLKIGSMTVTKQVVWRGQDPPPAQQTAPSTASVGSLIDAAKQAADQGRLADAVSSLRAALAALQAAQTPEPAVSSGVVRVGGTIKEPKKIRDVVPVYPQAAHDAGIQGVVIIEATIDRDGAVADAQILRGVPELNDAALHAVRQWMYTPTLLDGVPVQVLMTATVVFAIR